VVQFCRVIFKISKFSFIAQNKVVSHITHLPNIKKKLEHFEYYGQEKKNHFIPLFYVNVS